jgi:phosphodiesterase/alkaline phosphatase D-like protein
MPVGLQALLDYWPIEGPAHDPRRLYRAIRWGRHLEILVLDTRQYRSDQSETDGPAKTMLGPAQREWLLRALAASDATWKLVVTSVPLGMFTGGRHSDSWSNANLFGYPRTTASGYVYERDTILRFVRDRAIRNVVFISGDVHHAEIIRHEPSRASWCTSSSRARSPRGRATRASSIDRSTRAPSARSGSRRISASSSSTVTPCRSGSSTRPTRYAFRCDSLLTRR